MKRRWSETSVFFMRYPTAEARRYKKLLIVSIRAALICRGPLLSRFL
jgi:hypothetical protein